MFRLGIVVAAAVFVAAALLLLGLEAQRQARQGTEAQELAPTASRLQLAFDEQDVGPVRAGTLLAVPYAIANTGTERLWLRQVYEECCGTDVRKAVFIEPGLAGEVVAELNADDLAMRGRKHIRFLTSDPACPELWLTVRGTVTKHEIIEDPKSEEPKNQMDASRPSSEFCFFGS